MTQELTSNQPPDDFEASQLQVDLDHDPVIDDDDDSGLEAMLSDAYRAPAVPKSLVKRLDGGIEQQWGHSPELIPAGGTVTTLAGNGSRLLLRSWPYAAGIAATVLLAFFLAGGSGNYAWATVVDAIKRHGLIEIQDDSGRRWLDLSGQIAGEENRQRIRWVDLNKQTMLTRTVDSDLLFRDQISWDRSLDSQSLLAAFLLNASLSSESLQQFQDLEIVAQDWSRHSKGGREMVELQVQFQTVSDNLIAMSLWLDPETKLPQSVQVFDRVGAASAPSNLGTDRVSTSATPVSLVYVAKSSDQLQAIHFPAELSIVEGDEAAEASGSTERIASLTPASQARPAGDPARQTGRQSLADQGAASPNRNTHEMFVAALPIGAASQWRPVVVIPRSAPDVLAEVDATLEELWTGRNIEPVEQASDVQLLRRAYLDLAGRTPTVTEVRQYLADQDDQRYERLIDRLLQSPDHASQMAAVWRSFLIPEGVDLDAFGGREAFDKWLAERFANNEPYDQIVRKLLLAEGRLSQSGPLLFYSALKLDAHQLAAKTSRAFLGMRLECAQCHDHPFEPWSQEDFWSYAAFFAQISRPRGELENVSTVMRVHDVDRGEVMLPETESIVPPRFLGEYQSASVNTLDKSLSARRDQLAGWLTGPDNPYFARATVNRVWGHLFGRGIVDPIDDFGENNPPVSPELLDTLASQFIDSGFDLRVLLRTAALSKAYRLSSGSGSVDEAETADSEQRLETFAQMNVKTLTAEQLYDCIAVATLLDQEAGAKEQYSLARFGNSQRDEFLQRFAAPAASRSEYLAGIPQALTLMNGSLIHGATGESSSGLIQSLAAPFFSDRQRIDVVFMATLSRPARPDEIELLAEFIPEEATAAERAADLADLLWALINSSEFTLNH